MILGLFIIGLALYVWIKDGSFGIQIALAIMAGIYYMLGYHAIPWGYFER
jgi:hypothetical protein